MVPVSSLVVTLLFTPHPRSALTLLFFSSSPPLRVVSSLRDLFLRPSVPPPMFLAHFFSLCRFLCGGFRCRRGRGECVRAGSRQESPVRSRNHRRTFLLPFQHPLSRLSPGRFLSLFRPLTCRFVSSSGSAARTSSSSGSAPYGGPRIATWRRPWSCSPEWTRLCRRRSPPPDLPLQCFDEGR